MKQDERSFEVAKISGTITGLFALGFGFYGNINSTDLGALLLILTMLFYFMLFGLWTTLIFTIGGYKSKKLNHKLYYSGLIILFLAFVIQITNLF